MLKTDSLLLLAFIALAIPVILSILLFRAHRAVKIREREILWLRASLNDTKSGMIAWRAQSAREIVNEALGGFCPPIHDKSPICLDLLQRSLPEEERRELDRKIEDLRENGRAFVTKVRAPIKDGPYRIEGKRLYDGRGEPLVDLVWVDEEYLQGKLDRSDQKISKLQEKTRKLRAMLDIIPFALWRRGPDGTVLDANAAYHRALGEPLNHRKQDALPELVIDGKECQTGRHLAAKARNQGSVRAIAMIRNGTTWTKARIIETPFGSGTIGAADKIGAIERLYARIRMARANQRRIDAQLPIGVERYNKKRRLIDSNDAFAEMTGIAKSFLLEGPAYQDVIKERRRLGSLPDWSGSQGRQENSAWLCTESTGKSADLMDGRNWRTTHIPMQGGGLTILHEDITALHDPILSSSFPDKRAFASEQEIWISAFARLREGIAIFDREARLIQSNRSFRKFWGLSQEVAKDEPSSREITSHMATLLDDHSARAHADWLRGRLATRTTDELRVTTQRREIFHAYCVPLPHEAMLVSYLREGTESTEEKKQSVEVSRQRTPG